MLLILRKYKTRVAHAIQLVHVIVLIGLVMLVLGSFGFEHCPFVVIQNRQVGKALQISRVVLEDHAVRIERFQIFDYRCLELALQSGHWILTSLLTFREYHYRMDQLLLPADNCDEVELGAMSGGDHL